GDLAASGELVGDRDGIRGLAAAVQVENSLVDQLMRGPGMSGRTCPLDHVRDGVLGQQHPAEHALLRRDVVRRGPLEVVVPRRDLGDAHLTLLPRASQPSANALLPSPATVLAHGSDILAARHAGHQVTPWTAVWTRCADTPATLCAAWGQNCGNGGLSHRYGPVNRENAIHRLCGRKTSGGFSGG